MTALHSNFPHKNGYGRVAKLENLFRSVPLRNIYYQTFIYDPYILFETKLVAGFRFCYLGFRFTVPLFYDQPIKKIDFFHYPRVSTGDLPLTKKPVDSGYEIAFIRKAKFSDFFSCSWLSCLQGYLEAIHW